MMSTVVAAQPTSSTVRKSGSGSDHCEAVLSLSGRASSDVSGASSLADDLQRVSGSPQTRRTGAAEPLAKGAAMPQPQYPCPSQCPAAAATAGAVQEPPNHLNILVVGASNLGKTRFISDIARASGGTADCTSAPVKMSASPPGSPVSPPLPRSTCLDHHPGDLIVHLGPLKLGGSPSRLLHVSLLDAPAYDAEPNQALYLAKLLEYILWQQEKDHRGAAQVAAGAAGAGGEGAPGLRLSHAVSLCLYFLPPSEDVTHQDLAFMSALSQEVPLLPVLVVGASAAAAGRIAELRRAVLAAMGEYVRNGKLAPIKPLDLGEAVVDPAISDSGGGDGGGGAAGVREGGEFWSVLVYGGGPAESSGHEGEREAHPVRHSAEALFRSLLHPIALEAIMKSASERYEDFCERYEAYGHDAMCLLAELLEPYDKALLHTTAATTAASAAVRPGAAAARSAAPSASAEAALLEQGPSGPLTPAHPGAGSPQEPTTPEQTASVKSRDYSAGSGVAGTAAAAVAAAEDPSRVAVPAGAEPGALTAGGSPAAPGCSDREQLVSAIIEGLMTKLSRNDPEEGTEAAAAVAAVAQSAGGSPGGEVVQARDVELGREVPRACGAHPTTAAAATATVKAMAHSATVTTAAEARDLADGDAAAVHDAVHRAFTAALATAVAHEDAAAVHDAVHRAFQAALAKAAAADDATAVHDAVQRAFRAALAGVAANEDTAAVHDAVQRAFQAAVTKAKDDTAVHDAVQRVFQAVISSNAAPQELEREPTAAPSPSAGGASPVRAVGSLVRQGLAAVYATLAAATSAVQHATAGLYGQSASKSVPVVPEDAEAVVHAVVQRAVAAVVASVEAEADPVATLVRRALARAVREAEVEAAALKMTGSGSTVRVRASSGSAAAAAATARTPAAPRSWPRLGSELLGTIPASAAARQKELLGYIRGLLGAPAGGTAAAESGAEGEGSGQGALLRSGRPVGLGVGLGVGVAGLAAATVIVIALRQRSARQ